MEQFPDLSNLQTTLQALAQRRLVHYLSPPEQKRGVYVSHGLYPADEFEKVRQAFASRQPSDDEMPGRLSSARADLNAAAAAPGWVADVAALHDENAALRRDVNDLRTALEALAAELRALKSELGV